MTATSRTYAGRSRPPRHLPVAGVALPWLLAAATVGTQIAYPLVEGAALQRVTIATVVLFFATCVTHALVHRGPLFTLGLVVVSAGGGLAAEAVGVRTGYPFGAYSYAGTLGPEVLDVPVVVPLAWTMMAYPVLLAARRVGRRFAPVVGGLGLMAWDMFLDPQMVGDGHWTWADPDPSLTAIEGIPLTNFAGWAAVGTAMMLLLDRLLPRAGADELVPAALLGWTWFGYIVGNVFWFGETSVAVAAGFVLGLLVVPYTWLLWQSRD
ncbi:MAG: carotenoid biosynthesis protein [Pseudonocardia sp.]|nr:carotenoid biosynthesis protein [Pseudonocardia sp.]